MTDPEQPSPLATDPDDEHPAPDEARQVASSPEFVEAVAIALMRVVLDGAPDVGDEHQMVKFIVTNPRREAERFAVALATDPAIVAATLDPQARSDPAGFARLDEKLRAIWPVMAGQVGPRVVDHRDTPNTGKGGGA